MVISASRISAAHVAFAPVDAVITKAYAPILALGAVGGGAIGWILGRFGR